GGILWLTARWGAAFAPVIFGTMTRGIGALQTNVGDSHLVGWVATIPAWRIAFFASGALGVVWCLAFYPWFRDDPAQKGSVSAAELRHIESGRGPIEMGHRAAAKTWVDLFSSPSLWALAIYYLCGNIAWSFFVSWMPRYMKE